MPSRKKRVSSGLRQLDRLLGNLFIGDNVIWYDEAGSLALLFGSHLIKESVSHKKPVIYVSFDRSPRNLLDQLGPLAQTRLLTILDCFTNGKGDGSEVFADFYEKDGASWPFQIVRVNGPIDPDQVAEAVYGLHRPLSGDVRFIFESLSGMQDLWGGEEAVSRFYTRTCPRLYELETIAYWFAEKDAHSQQLKASINQIAQVVIDLSLQRGRSALSLVKAENRQMDSLNRPYRFWSDGTGVRFEIDQTDPGLQAVGRRVRDFRTRQGLSQKEMAQLAGVTPSTVSQVESGTIFPSLPVLFKLAEALSVGVESFFSPGSSRSRGPVYPLVEARGAKFKDLPPGSISGQLLMPLDVEARVEPLLLEVPPGRTVPSHFCRHKGEELGFLISGHLEVLIGNAEHRLGPGDVLHLSSEDPGQWRNIGTEPARLLWLKIT
jgi:transcriptional regulator with XRE-family HTH domain/KaiC/GvpD/RAD55 family RecA-like ATPase